MIRAYLLSAASRTLCLNCVNKMTQLRFYFLTDFFTFLADFLTDFFTFLTDFRDFLTDFFTFLADCFALDFRRPNDVRPVRVGRPGSTVRVGRTGSAVRVAL